MIKIFLKAGNTRIWPICIPTKPIVDKDHLAFRSAQVVGYGHDIDREKQVLSVIDLTINQISICNEKYTLKRSDSDYFVTEDKLPQKFNGGSVFCASRYGSNSGTCGGDSGG